MAGNDNWFIYDPKVNRSRMKWARSDAQIPHPITADQAYKRSVKSADRIVAPMHRDERSRKLYKNIMRTKFNEDTGLVDFEFSENINPLTNEGKFDYQFDWSQPIKDYDQDPNSRPRRKPKNNPPVLPKKDPNVLPRRKRSSTLELDRSQTGRMEPQKTDQNLAAAQENNEAKIRVISNEGSFVSRLFRQYRPLYPTPIARPPPSFDDSALSELRKANEILIDKISGEP